MKRAAAILLVVCGVVLCAKLGFWQLERLAWKEDLIAKLETAKLENNDLSTLLQNPDGEYHHGYVRGQWIPKQSFVTANVTMNGRFGHWIVTPLKLADGSQVLVNRGWVEQGQDDRVLATPLPKGEVTVTGTLRRPGNFLEEKAQGQLVLFADMADHRELTPAPLAASLRNEHKNYAIFWFTMAGLLLVLSGFSLLKVRSVSSQDP